ncbi:unnamed protein product [Arabidopsis thaliana]|uniref:Phytocyanin domain-containing protein n=1 Tax=Arabidopsis thaliana TaxID=3702 RepID=A0A5S9XNV6_ARATH|nr:unnamed protein product [Arabidopsis thaliana]
MGITRQSTRFHKRSLSTIETWFSIKLVFHVGDSLIFEHNHNLNDVTQVSGALEYEFCDSSSPKAVYNPGHDISWCGSKGWSVSQESDFYYRWNEKTQFPIGDSLLFEYDNEVNDVLEISGDLEFISCYPISPVAVHMTGHDLVTLTEPGVHYFISSKTPGHCYAGLKLRVVVGPLTKAVPVPNVPTKKIELSLMDRFNRWLRTFGPQPHH